MDSYQKITLAWEKRSHKYGTKIEGVLPKSFPKEINLYLHQWMFKTIVDNLDDTDKKEIRVLDLGCGYGRLSKEILRRYKNVKTFGVDISQNYVDLFNKQLNPRGQAVKADLRNLPFKNNQFDLVFVITTLMYLLTKKDHKESLKEIFRVAKPNSKIIIIERNKFAHNLLTLGGLVSLIRGKRNQEIDAVSFDKNYMIELISKEGGEVIKLIGIPLWTIFLPFSIIFSKINSRIIKIFLVPVDFFDRLFNWILTPSLYISYIVEKRKS